jgi:hypothetical protein
MEGIECLKCGGKLEKIDPGIVEYLFEADEFRSFGYQEKIFQYLGVDFFLPFTAICKDCGNLLLTAKIDTRSAPLLQDLSSGIDDLAEAIFILEIKDKVDFLIKEEKTSGAKKTEEEIKKATEDIKVKLKRAFKELEGKAEDLGQF